MAKAGAEGAWSAARADVRPPRQAEAPAVRLLLAEALAELDRAPEEVLLARRERGDRRPVEHGDDGRGERAVAPRGPAEIAGAAVGVPALRRGLGRWHLRVALRVIEPQRRRGIGRALIDALARAAARRDLAGLLGWRAVREGSELAAFLEAVGFVAVQREAAFEAPVARMAEVVRPVVERLSRGGRVPTGLRVVSFAEVAASAVIALHLRALGGTPGSLRRRVAEVRREGEQNPSVALAVPDVAGGGERLAGFILVRRGPEGAFDAEARVLAPDARFGIANALLLDGVVRRGLALGAERFRFSAPGGNRDTEKLAERLGARPLDRMALYARSLAPDHAGG